MNRLTAVLRLVLAELALAVATLEWSRLYVDGTWMRSAAVAVGAGALVGVATSGWSGRLRAVVPLVVLGVAALVVFLVASDGGRRPSAVGSTVLDGWRQLLTVVLPADAEGALLGPPTIVSFICSFAAARWSWRDSPVTLPFLPSLVQYGVALPFAAAGEPSDLRRPAAAFAVFVLALAFGSGGARTRSSSRRGPTRATPEPRARAVRHQVGRVAFALPAVTVAVGGAWFVGHSERAATRDPFELRSLTTPPIEVDRSLSPLAQVVAEAGRENGSFGAVTLATDADAPPVVRVGVAALGDYDGAVFTAGGEYRRAGAQLPIADRVTGNWPTVEQNFELERLPWPFLPAIGTPVGLEVIAPDDLKIAFDPTSGQLVAGRAAGGGASRALDYAVESRTPPDVDTASTASTDDGAEAFASLPQVSDAATEQLDDIRELAQETTGTAATDREKLDALVELLRSTRYSSRSSAAESASVPTGHSIGRIHEFLLGASDSSGAQIGYSEQYAAALAILGRSLGIPTRVMVGFVIDDVPPGSSGAERPLEAANLTAWTQVLFERVGWVDIDPFDGANTGDVTPPETPLSPETQSEDRLDEAVDCSDGSPTFDVAACPEITPPQSPVDPRSEGGGIPWWALPVAMVPFVLIGAVAVSKRVRRRRRRTAATPAERVIGAWLDVSDALIESGHSVVLEETPAEVSNGVRELDDPELVEPLDELVPIVDLAVFGPSEPPESDVDSAWLLADEFRRRNARRRSPVARVLSPVDPRPLVRRRTTRRSAGPRVARSATPGPLKVRAPSTEAETEAPRRFARRPRPTDER